MGISSTLLTSFLPESVGLKLLLIPYAVVIIKRLFLKTVPDPASVGTITIFHAKGQQISSKKGYFRRKAECRQGGSDSAVVCTQPNLWHGLALETGQHSPESPIFLEPLSKTSLPLTVDLVVLVMLIKISMSLLHYKEIRFVCLYFL